MSESETKKHKLRVLQVERGVPEEVSYRCDDLKSGRVVVSPSFFLMVIRPLMYRCSVLESEFSLKIHSNATGDNEYLKERRGGGGGALHVMIVKCKQSTSWRASIPSHADQVILCFYATRLGLELSRQTQPE